MALLNSVTVPLFLPHVFPLGLYLGLEMEAVNGRLLPLVIIRIQVVIWVKGYQEETSNCIFSQYSRSGASNAEEMEKIAPPSSEGEWGEVGEPRNLFPRLGVG